MRHVQVYSQRTVEVEEKDDKTGKITRRKVTYAPEFIGSGVFYQPGKVLTAKHVVIAKDYDGNAFKPVFIRMPETFTAKGVSKWREVPIDAWRVSDTDDLAVLYLSDKTAGVSTEIGDEPDIGESLFSVTSPFGEVTYSSARVQSYVEVDYRLEKISLLVPVYVQSGKDRISFTALGHNLVVAPGSSGGGVFHRFRLVGIHVAGTVGYPTLAYAVPAGKIKAFLKL
jgi:V8-like Glu-specific endopeptidase